MSSTLSEIASRNNITLKKIFLENVEVAMEPAKVIKEYKQ
jgi:ribosomal protein L20A (L18A)